MPSGGQSARGGGWHRWLVAPPYAPVSTLPPAAWARRGWEERGGEGGGGRGEEWKGERRGGGGGEEREVSNGKGLSGSSQMKAGQIVRDVMQQEELQL